MTDTDPPNVSRRGLLAVAGAGVAAQAIPASAEESRRSRGRSNVSVVLVHGAFTDGSCWNEVIPRLEALGYRASAVQNPLSSLADDVLATRRLLERQAGRVVLVGHSWAGAVITEAGVAANVAALAYISALAPDRGESVMDLQKNGPPGPAMEAAKPDAHGYLWFDPERYHAGLAGDVSPARARWMAATQQPIATRCFGDTIGEAAWRTKPAHYLISEDDQALSPVLQHWMAKRMGAGVKTVASSHMSLVSHADATADLIAKAAQAIS